MYMLFIPSGKQNLLTIVESMLCFLDSHTFFLDITKFILTA